MRSRIFLNRPFLLVVPTILLLVLSLLIPEIWALYTSLTNYTIGSTPQFVGLSNYTTIFHDSQFWNAAMKNLLFVFCAVSLEITLGLLFSLLLSKGFRFQRFWVALVLSPYAVSPAVAAATWKYLLDFNMGPINFFLSQMGISRLRWLSDPNLAFASIILVYIWQTIPFVVLILYPALISFPKELYDATAVDGATGLQCFRFVTLPLLKPALFVALVFRIIISFRAFGHIWALTQGGPLHATELLSIYMYRQGFRYWQFGKAAAVGWLMLILTMMLASYQMQSMYKKMFLK